MMRPPPGGTLPHNAHRSSPQNERICIAWRGIIGGIGPSGATAAGGGAPAGGTAAAGGGASLPQVVRRPRHHRPQGRSGTPATARQR